jgi:hypothetical protein
MCGFVVDEFLPPPGLLLNSSRPVPSVFVSKKWNARTSSKTLVLLLYIIIIIVVVVVVFVALRFKK